ncbi:MAG: hypothetical protein ACFFB1_14730 [Promethearchaeota archaeon]
MDKKVLDNLKRQIKQLKLELDKKENEIYGHLEKIDNLEEELLQFHDFISEKASQETIQKAFESKFTFEIKEKERVIRELKNRMGFLRKEKNAAQKELNDLKRKKSISSKINIDEIREKNQLPKEILLLESSIKHLQNNLNSKDSLIERLKDEIEILNEKLEEKSEKIEQLNLKFTTLNQELEIISSIGKNISSEIVEEETSKRVKKKIKKLRKENQELERKQFELEMPDKEKIIQEIESVALKNKIAELERKLSVKSKEIKDLKSQKFL